MTNFEWIKNLDRNHFARYIAMNLCWARSDAQQWIDVLGIGGVYKDYYEWLDEPFEGE